MSSSEDERKKRSDTESEEESEEVETSEEEESEEESEESEEETSESTEASDKTSNSSASAKATPRSATATPRSNDKKEEKKDVEYYNPPSPKKTKAKEENGEGKKDKKKKKKKGKNDEQSVVVIDGRTVLKKTFELAKDKLIEFTVSVENRPYKPEEKVEIKFEIKNQTSKTMKSIKCVLETKGVQPEGKDKKKKKPKKGEAERGVPTGTEDEFYCGARFPLDKYTDFKGTSDYRLPKKVEKSSGQIKHELHLMFPIRSRPINSWKNIDAWLPIEIN